MFVKLGNWLFHHRNILFPIFYAALFIPSLPLFAGNELLIILGAFFIGLGITIRCVTIGLVYIVRGGLNRKIYAEELVTGGIYQICRNPMYLGNILLIIGFGIFANSLLFLTILAPLFIIFYVAIIKAEENFLFNKFGSQFQEYKKTSNALIPKLSRFKGAFRGHKFNFQRVVRKEYNSLFLYLSGILILLWNKQIVSWNSLLIASLPLLIIYLTMKWLKKTNRL